MRVFLGGGGVERGGWVEYGLNGLDGEMGGWEVFGTPVFLCFFNVVHELDA